MGSSLPFLFDVFVLVHLIGQMLRTCSLPDLSKLFKSPDVDAPEGNGPVAPDNNLEIEDLEENGKADEQSEPEE